MDQADIEGDAQAILREGKMLDVDGPTPMAELCRRLLGSVPRRCALRTEAKLGRDEETGRPVVFLRRGVPAPRARWLVGHELAEHWLRSAGYQGEDIERRADAIGAALAVQREPFLRAIRSTGHRVHELARVFCTTQSLALLRVGETIGRPVALLRPNGTIARGEPFVWPRTSTLVRALTEGRATVHPLRIVDEPDRWGLMARI